MNKLSYDKATKTKVPVYLLNNKLSKLYIDYIDQLENEDDKRRYTSWRNAIPKCFKQKKQYTVVYVWQENHLKKKNKNGYKYSEIEKIKLDCYHHHKESCCKVKLDFENDCNNLNEETCLVIMDYKMNIHMETEKQAGSLFFFQVIKKHFLAV